MNDNQFNDVMIDIETLGTKPGCVVHEIAGVAFNLDTMETGEEFRVSIDIDDAERQGLTIDDETWDWWQEQGGIVLDEPESFVDAFNLFGQWMSKIYPERVWSCGTCFERPILEHCFALLDLDPPYRYGQGRDFRTEWDLAFPGVKRDKAKHRALVDCHMQIIQLGQALEVRPVGGESAKYLCTWNQDEEGTWESECGQAWQFESDGLAENKVRFCHYCGKAVKEGGGE